MEGVDHILNWKLKAGSHRFLGSEGSTRIAEAALVAIGFESQPIVHIWQMPSCFSRTICHLALWLNDIELRNRSVGLQSWRPISALAFTWKGARAPIFACRLGATFRTPSTAPSRSRGGARLPRGVVRCLRAHTHRAAAGTSPRAVRPVETDWALWRK